MPSEIRVISQSRRGAPMGSRSIAQHPFAELAEQVSEPLDAHDPALSLRALEDRRGVVAALDRLGEPPVDDRLGPLLEQVGVVREVHDVDRPSARRPRADLSEHDLPALACGTTPCA